MRQPEAKFKEKIVELHAADDTSDWWHTYLTPGAGQASGLPDLIVGDSRHGLYWVEAKIGKAPKLRPLQEKALMNLHRSRAKVVIPCLDGDVVHLWAPGVYDFTHFADAALGPALWPEIWRLS